MDESVTVRVAHVEERAPLESLQWRASLANAGDRDALLANPDAIELSLEQLRAGQVFVAERAGVVLGFSSVRDRYDGDVELDGLFVEPEFWRGGVGALLVARAVRYGAERNARWLHVIGNTHAASFYDACGFEPSGVGATDFGSGALMRKRVNAI